MGRKKRTISVTSPEPVSFLSPNPDKRPARHDTYSAMMSQGMTQAFSPPPSQSILPQFPQVPPYQGANGQLYTPIQSAPPQPYTSPGYQTQQPMPSQIPAAPQPSSTNFNFQQFVVEKLEAMDRRLNKLDVIENQISTLSQKLSIMDGRVTSLQ